MWTTLVIAAAFAAFGSFAWGLKRHFRVEGDMPGRMRRLTTASTAAFLLFIVLAFIRGVPPGSGLAALALFLGGIALFWWAVRTTRSRPPAVAHTDNIPTMIHADGPYAYVRHPFYLAYTLGWLGTAVAGGPILWIPAAVIIGWYYVTAREEEAHFATSAVAEDYARYRSRTGLILPRLPQRNS
ncbi:methyltransferase family protein [Pseudoroseomonas globiformis]|uniref:Methyltransferase family protein n=1 Tax=Teichococcus globiformis TaxID=2307229 RepID=A0ABV7G089_9PROT